MFLPSVRNFKTKRSMHFTCFRDARRVTCTRMTGAQYFDLGSNATSAMPFLVECRKFCFAILDAFKFIKKNIRKESFSESLFLK